MTSVLGRSATATLELVPFPHLIVDNALDADVYAQLVALFPSIEMVNRRARPIRNNHLYLLSAVDVLANEHIAAHWRTFFAYHVSRAFWLEALALLKTQLLAINPSLERRAARPLEDFRVAMRDRNADADAEISLDCQFGINSAVTRASSVRSPHLDNPTKLFNALLYCRAVDDDTPGGELILYRRSGTIAYGKGSSVLPSRVAPAKRVAYRANRLVLFLNSPLSVHGVAPRPRTLHVRRYINLLCEFREPLFALQRASFAVRCVGRARAALRNFVGRDSTPLGESV